MLFVHSILLQDIMKNNNIVRAYQLFPDSRFFNCEFFVKLIKKSSTKRHWGYGTMKLSRYEQETVVNYNAGEQTATLYTRDKAVMRKLDTLVTDFPDTYKPTAQDEVSEMIGNKQEVMAKRTAKNSVFLDLFQNKSYLLKLYKTLHPEDTTSFSMI